MVWSFAAIGVGVVLVALLGVVFWKWKKGDRMETNYYSLFTIGMIWLPLGIVFMATDLAIGPFFFILGLVFMGIGLSHRDKWPANKKKEVKKK